MNRYEIGDICIAFEGKKRRPVVIINNGLGIDIDMSIARVSSQKARNEFDIVIEKWEKAGLEQPSIIRCSKINTIDPTDISYKIGKLDNIEIKKVIETVKKYFEKGLEQI